MGTPSRTTADDLIDELREAREIELALFTDLTDDQMLGPEERFLEPPIWEIGHVGWFQEYWILRTLYREPPILKSGDSIYDSFNVSYKRRWDHDFPSRAETLDYVRLVLDRCSHRLAGREPTPREAYFYRFVTQHEYMHSENLAMVCHTLGYGLPVLPHGDRGPVGFDTAYPRRDVGVPGASYPLGAPKDEPFVFDNEKWAHAVEIEPFRIANTPVTNAEFVEFVDAGGYGNRRCWGKRGWEWRRRQGVEHPRFWSKRGGRWCQKSFDETRPLAPWHPVVHVNWHEAKAYCVWAGRRLPTGGGVGVCGEWSGQASLPRGARRHPRPSGQTWTIVTGGRSTCGPFLRETAPFGCRQMVGNVWEWTDSYLAPYPGFVPDPYKEYSQPYFGQKPVLRGGAWTTRSGMIRNTWRNFFVRHRRNIAAGFRTCAR